MANTEKQGFNTKYGQVKPMVPQNYLHLLLSMFHLLAMYQGAPSMLVRALWV